VKVGGDGVFRSAIVKGLWLQVDWLWARTPLTEIRRLWRLN
jgi:hypothetical protein